MVPLVREQTVKSVLTIITKLPDRTVNGELLKHLAKTANDEQPGIRTNTTICLGKIARNLGPHVRIPSLCLETADQATDQAESTNCRLYTLSPRSVYACPKRRPPGAGRDI